MTKHNIIQSTTTFQKKQRFTKHNDVLGKHNDTIIFFCTFSESCCVLTLQSRRTQDHKAESLIFTLVPLSADSLGWVHCSWAETLHVFGLPHEKYIFCAKNCLSGWKHKRMEGVRVELKSFLQHFFFCKGGTKSLFCKSHRQEWWSDLIKYWKTSTPLHDGGKYCTFHSTTYWINWTWIISYCTDYILSLKLSLDCHFLTAKHQNVKVNVHK